MAAAWAGFSGWAASSAVAGPSSWAEAAEEAAVGSAGGGEIRCEVRRREEREDVLQFSLQTAEFVLCRLV